MKLLLALFCLFLLLPAAALPSTHIIDAAGDLPYTTSSTYDTVSVTVNGIISAVSGTTITLAHDHSVLLLNGNALYVAQVVQNGWNYGVWISGDSCSITPGTLEQNASSTNDSCVIVGIAGAVRKVTLTNVNVHARGYSSQGIRAEGASEVWLNGGNWTSYVSDFDSREYQWTAPILLRDEVEAARTDPQQFRYWVSHVTIDSCPHAGIVMNGGTLWCDSNFVRVDARNHWTYPSGDIFRGTANGYGLAIDRIGSGCRVIGNTIRSGKNHRGGRGIALDGQAGYLIHHYIEVAYNDDSTHAGPDANYGGEYESVGFRIRDTGTDSLYFHHNTVVVVADTADATLHTGPGCIAVWMSDNGIFWKFENNIIKAAGISQFGERGAGSSYGGSYARAIAFDELHMTDSTVWHYNRIESNVAPVSYGEVNTENIAGENSYFYGDTINRSTPDYQDEWGNDGAIVMSLGSGDCENNYMTDPVFEHDSTVYWDGSGPGELTFQRIFVPVVFGSNGVPFAGARVRIRNAYGTSVVIDTTDTSGRIDSVPVAIRYNHLNVGTDSTFSPFTVSAIYVADSVGLAESSVGLTTNLIDTLRLANTLGGIIVRTPITVATGLSLESHMRIPRDKSESDSGLLVVSPEQTSDTQPILFKSADSGATWTSLTGMMINAEFTQGHQAEFGQYGVGLHYGMASSAGAQYRFIAYPYNSTGLISPLRTVDASHGTPRVSLAASGNRTFMAVRSQSIYDSVWVFWSNDRFGSTAGSQVIYVGGNAGTDNIRIHMMTDEDGNVVLFVWQMHHGVRYWQFNGTSFVAPANSVINTIDYESYHRGMCYGRTNGVWHVFVGEGYSNPSYLYHYQSTSGTSWTRTLVSSGPGDALGWAPAAEGRGDSLCVYYYINSAADVVVGKFWTETKGWDEDSIRVSGSDVVARNNLQAPVSAPVGQSYFWCSYLTTAGALQFVKLDVSGTASVDSTETISTPNAPSGSASGTTGESLSYSISGTSSSLDHVLQYRFDWDGSYSTWSASTSASHSWSTAGVYSVRCQSRCATHTGIVSSWSPAIDVTITGEPVLTSHLIKGMLRP